jgi:polysaccharide export outer membrane protein
MKRTLLCLLTVWLAALFSSTAVAKENTYKIGPADVLEISVWKDQSLTREIVVPPDGVIAFPLIKDIDVTDLTVPALRDVVSKKLSAFVPDATVTVILTKSNTLTAFVVGKVNKPGQYPIGMTTNVMQIIAMAGDLNPFSSPGKILVLRQDGKGKTIPIPFDYTEVKKGEKLEQNTVLQRGDVVVVP